MRRKITYQEKGKTLLKFKKQSLQMILDFLISAKQDTLTTRWVRCARVEPLKDSFS
jgi:hypothetical protein